MKKFSKITLSVLLAFSVSACNNDEWNITRESYNNFLKLDSSIEGSSENMTYVLQSDLVPFKDDISFDDVLFFNADTLSFLKNEDYYSYRALKKSEVKAKTFEVLDAGTGFAIGFDGNPNTHYGVLVNSDAVIPNQYVFSIAAKTFNENKVLFGGKSDEEIQDEWNNKYIKQSAEYNKTKNVLDMAQHICNIVIGAFSGAPTAVISGVFGLLSMANNLQNKDPSTRDVYNKLIDIEKKLSEISDLINENTRILMQEDLYIETQIDKALVELYKQNYNDYITNYVEPLETIKRDYDQYHEARLAEIVNGDSYSTIQLRYEEVDGFYRHLCKSEAAYNAEGVIIKNISIPNYDNAKKFLTDHGQTVSNGFIDALNLDFENAVEKAIEEGIIEVNGRITFSDYKMHLYETILDDLEQARYEGSYGSDPYKKAQELLNATINLANRISGGHGTDSIVDSIIQRIRCMYNFQNEGRKIIRSFLANIKLTLEVYATFASSACSYAKISQSELGEAYLKAIEVIQNYDKINDELKDNYCYIFGRNLETNFVKSIFNLSYTNPGNHCVFHKEYTWSKVDGFSGWGGPRLIKLDVDNVKLVDQSSHLKINERRKVLASMGYDVADNYFDYLMDNDYATRFANTQFFAMRNANWIGDDAYRLLTSFDGIKQLDNNDRTTFHCVAKGNPGGDYFKIGDTAKYRDSKEEDCWYGAKAMGKYIEVDSLESKSNQVISTYAKYEESHALWIDDEYYGFLGNPSGDYFFATFLL